MRSNRQRRFRPELCLFDFQTAAFADTASRSRRASTRVLLWNVRPLISEGAGNAGRPMRPQPRVQCVGSAHEVTTVTPESPGIPRAMALTVSFGGYRSDLGKRGRRIFLPRGLDRKFSDLPVGPISIVGRVSLVSRRRNPPPGERWRTTLSLIRPTGRRSTSKSRSACMLVMAARRGLKRSIHDSASSTLGVRGVNSQDAQSKPCFHRAYLCQPNG
jgi:hypothetical protein